MQTYGGTPRAPEAGIRGFPAPPAVLRARGAVPDDPVVREILPRVHKPILTYGIDTPADVRATGVRQDGLTMYFTVELPGAKHGWPSRSGQLKRHNVLNAVAAIGIANAPGRKAWRAIQRALANFSGIGRRFQLNGTLALNGGGVILVDDYGHHPREIAATVAVRARAAWPQRRLVVVPAAPARARTS